MTGRTQSGWSEQREREKAALLAEIVRTVEVLTAEGVPGRAIVDRLRDEAQSRRLTLTGRIGNRTLCPKSARTGQESAVPCRAGDTKPAPGSVWTGGGGGAKVSPP